MSEVNHSITSNQAQDYFENYQEHKDAETLIKVDAEVFDAQQVLSILQTPGAEKFVVRKGATDQGEEKTVLYVVNNQNQVLGSYLQNAIPPDWDL